MIRTYRGAVFKEGDICTLDMHPPGTHPSHGTARKVVVRKVTRGGRDIHIEHDQPQGAKEIVHASRLTWGWKP